MNEHALKQLRWLNSKTGGGLSQAQIAERMGTNQSGVSLYFTRGVKTAQLAILVGYVFEHRCAELGLDPATVDASLETDDSHAFAA